MTMRGLVIGQESVDTVLVRLASAREMAEVLAAPEVVVGVPTAGAASSAWGSLVAEDVYIRRADSFLKVGVVTDIYVNHDRIDVTSRSDRFRRYKPGLSRAEGRFVVVW